MEEPLTSMCEALSAIINEGAGDMARKGREKRQEREGKGKGRGEEERGRKERGREGRGKEGRGGKGKEQLISLGVLIKVISSPLPIGSTSWQLIL